MNGIKKMDEFELALRLAIWKLYKKGSETLINDDSCSEVKDLLSDDSKLIGFRYFPSAPFIVTENNGAKSSITVSYSAFYNDTQYSNLDSVFIIGITNSDFGMTITVSLTLDGDPMSFIHERKISEISFNGERLNMDTYEGYLGENLVNGDRITNILIKLSAMLS